MPLLRELLTRPLERGEGGFSEVSISAGGIALVFHLDSCFSGCGKGVLKQRHLLPDLVSLLLQRDAIPMIGLGHLDQCREGLLIAIALSAGFVSLCGEGGEFRRE